MNTKKNETYQAMVKFSHKQSNGNVPHSRRHDDVTPNRPNTVNCHPSTSPNRSALQLHKKKKMVSQLKNDFK